MNEYGEIISLPYKAIDLYEPLKRLLKYDKLKSMVLKKLDEQNKSFDLVTKKGLFIAERVNIKIEEITKFNVKIRVCSKSSLIMPFDFGRNRKNVKKIINIIFDELKNCEKSKDDDFSIEIIKTYKFSKSLLQFILAGIVFYLLWSWFFLVTGAFDNTENDKLTTTAFTLGFIITPIIYKIFRVIRLRSYNRRRVYKIKQSLYNLIEGKTNNLKEEKIAKEVIQNKINNDNKEDVVNKVGIYLKKGIDYAKETKKQKPLIFWGITFAIGAYLTWLVFGGVSDPCAFNVKMGGFHVTDISWCRTDYKISSHSLPSGFNVTSDDFVYCQYGTPDTSYGWAEGYVYKKCAIKKGWNQ
jgi:uncharacterized membrane protein YciS (DUF1049 family)